MAALANLLIFGASTRAAAFSAIRAGLRPWCGDLFADADLQGRCPVSAIPPELYPDGFAPLADSAPEGPWMYTGALENHDQVVHAIAQQRILWGNGQSVLERARSPHFVAQLLQDARLPHPEVFYEFPDEQPSDGQWLIKPLKSAGGIGIRRWTPGQISTRRVYLQEYIDGVPCSGVYVGDGREARLLGVTEQLIGESRLHAGPFRYCGSIGPLMPDKRQWDLFMRIGNVIAAGCKLRGLFGIDFILGDDGPFAVEINPRYTASVEVIEHATQTAALALHAHVFDPTISPSPLGGEGWGEGAKASTTLAPSPPTPLPQGERGERRPTSFPQGERGASSGSPLPSGGEGLGVRGQALQNLHPSPPTPLPQGERGVRSATPLPQGERDERIVGKAILFAWKSVLFPAEGPWMDSLRNPHDLWEVPSFADIPQPGEVIEVGRPILTFFATADSVQACKEKLWQIGAELEDHIFSRR